VISIISLIALISDKNKFFIPLFSIISVGSLMMWRVVRHERKLEKIYEKVYQRSTPSMHSTLTPL
jgi:hypothetical protein